MTKKYSTLIKGRRYRASVILSGFECLASNDQIAQRLERSGFVSVVVTGDGSKRKAEGTWTGDTKAVLVDSHFTKVVEI